MYSLSLVYSPPSSSGLIPYMVLDLQTLATETKLTIQIFSVPVVLKLDPFNFLSWKDHIKAIVEGYELLHRLTGKDTPKKFTSEANRSSEIISSEYKK
ncbi:Retrovirus-related Pol polyprotein [Arachis hypogaea]|nr:Retrovirus-related Pol polyprotein [Arachis hypogaea]